MNVKKEEFTVTKVEAHKKRALSEGCSVHQGISRYICGYDLSTGVEFRKVGDHVFLCAHMSVHQGIIDDVLEWPLEEFVTITVKHPSGNKERQYMARMPDLLRPKGNQNSIKSTSWTSTGDISLDDLESEGYVVRDKFRVVWEFW